MSRAFDAACRTLESLGARLVDLQLSPLIDYLDANRLIMLAEAYALHETGFSRAAAGSSAITCSRGSGSARF